MKSVKKLFSLILSLAIIFGVMAIIPTTTVSAAAGDVFEVTSLPDSWKWYSSAYVTRENSGAKFSVNADKGKGLDNYGILACNSQSADIIKPNTTYKIEMRIETWFELSKLQIDVDTATALWSRNNKVTSITDLSSIASDITGGNGSKLYATVKFNITTPATISGNQHFVIGVIPKSGGTGGTANLKFYNIKITELGYYDVVDENGNVLDTVIGVPGDDALALVNASAANKDGVEIESVSPATIAADTTQIVVTYKKAEIVEEPKVITFDETYLQNKPNNWTYYAEDSSGLLAIKNGSMTLKDSAVVPNVGTSFGNRAFLAANNYQEYLTPGAGYQVIVKITTFPQYTPLNKLSLDIKFGTGVWKETSGAPIYTYTGAQLEKMVSNNPTASSSGSVMFEIKSYVKVPETGNNNLLVSVYGGDFYVSEVIITPAVELSVVDEAGTHLGNVLGLVGEKTADLIPDSLKTDADCDYTTEPEIVEDILAPIVLKNSLKANIVQKINFSSTEYGGNNDPNGQYYSKDASYGKLVLQSNAIKGDKINYGVTFGHRAILLANDRTNSGIVAGETYRVSVSFTSWYYLEKAFGLQIAFGANVWNTTNTLTYEGNDLTQFVSNFKDGAGNSSNSYTLTFDVTVPENANNIIISLYGTGDKNVEYWLSKAYVYSDVDVIDYTFTHTMQLKTTEPWGMFFNASVKSNGVLVNYETLKDYGIYVIAADEFEGEITADAVVNQGKKLDTNIVEVDGKKVIQAVYDNIATYQMSKEFYAVFYAVDKNGNTSYGEVKTRSYETVINQYQDAADKYSEELLTLCDKMDNLNVATTNYRDALKGRYEFKSSTPVTATEYDFSKIADGKYTFGHTMQMSTIEPWALIFNCAVRENGKVIDYNSCEDYGVVILTGVDEVPTLETIVTNENALVYSKENNSIYFDEKKEGYICADYTELIKTSEMDRAHYAVFFVKVNGEYHFGDVKIRSMMSIAEQYLNIEQNYESKELFVALLNAMKELYVATEAYYAK